MNPKEKRSGSFRSSTTKINTLKKEKKKRIVKRLTPLRLFLAKIWEDVVGDMEPRAELKFLQQKDSKEGKRLRIALKRSKVTQAVTPTRAHTLPDALTWTPKRLRVVATGGGRCAPALRPLSPPPTHPFSSALSFSTSMVSSSSLSEELYSG